MPALPPCPVPRYLPFHFSPSGSQTSNPISFSILPSTLQNGLLTVTGRPAEPGKVHFGGASIAVMALMLTLGKRKCLSKSHESVAGNGRVIAMQANAAIIRICQRLLFVILFSFPIPTQLQSHRASGFKLVAIPLGSAKSVIFAPFDGYSVLDTIDPSHIK